MGDTLRFAQQLPLTAMRPRGDLSSTVTCSPTPAGNTSSSQPAGRPARSRDTGPRHLHRQWHSVTSRQRAAAADVTTSGSAVISFTAPFATPGPAVLHVTQTGPPASQHG
jgi:hypothetical protein